jgi:hypothetical protein
MHPEAKRILLDSLIPEPEQRKDRRWETKIMAVADRHGLPLAIRCKCYGLRSEVGRFTPLSDGGARGTYNLVGDNAYDSDKLNSEL